MPSEKPTPRPSEKPTPRRTIVYCIVPSDLAAKLHAVLRRHFAEDPAVEVVVEQRSHDRRRGEERRRTRTDGTEERRRVKAADGRRMADRRMPVLPTPPQTLPRRARAHADRLIWVGRLERSTQSDEDIDTARLVARIQAGEEELFAELYLRYFDRVYSYLRFVLNDDHEAEDAAQQAFINVLAALPRYERRRQPFRAWLFTIVRNQSLNCLRARRVPVDLTDSGDIASEYPGMAIDTETDALAWVSDRELLILLERLPIAQRQALFLRFQLDLAAPAIAEIMQRSPDDVRMLQYRALRFLQDRLIALGRCPDRSRHVRARGRLREATVLRARRFAISRSR